MKKIMKPLLIAVALVISTMLYSQDPPPPPPNGNGGAPSGENGNNPVGGGVPLDGGVIVFMLLGVAYGGLNIAKTSTKDGSFKI